MGEMAMKSLLVLALICTGLVRTGGAAAAEGCAPFGALNFVCGPEATEDLVRVGDSPWLIGSGLAEGGAAGHLHLINARDKTWVNFYPASGATAAPDARRFASCPAPPDAAKFSAHGIALRSLGGGPHELLVVNHGGREAIEYFELRTGGARPTIQWTGCVPVPGDIYVNSVVALRDGGFIASHFYSPGKGGINPVFARQVTGGLLEWHAGRAVTLIPGTELSGANGIAASPDERVLHVAAWGTRELVRFERRGDTVTKRVVPVNFAPDNLRWSRDGKSLLVAGQKFVAREGGQRRWMAGRWRASIRIRSRSSPCMKPTARRRCRASAWRSKSMTRSGLSRSAAIASGTSPGHAEHRDPMSITFRQLEIFVAAATDCNFRCTADRLGVSQPSISNQIRALEEQIQSLSKGAAAQPDAAAEGMHLERRELVQGRQTWSAGSRPA
jgi:hypothetical protein